MRYGAAFRRFPQERLHVGNAQSRCCAVRRFNNIEMGASGSDVPGIQHDAARNTPLNVEIPRLHVTETIVAVHAEAIGNGRGRRNRKSVLERQSQCARSNVRLSHCKRRLKRQLLHDVVVGRVVVIDPITGPHNGVIHRPPCNAYSRTKVIPIRIDQRGRKLTRERPNFSWQHGRHCGESGGRVQVHNSVFGFAERRNIFVTQSEIQGESRQYSPVILEEEIPGIRPELIAVGAIFYGSELWQAQEEICKIETGVGASERETSSRVIVSSGIQLNAAELYSPAHGMFDARPDHRVAELQRLVNPPGSVQIADAGVIRK